MDAWQLTDVERAWRRPPVNRAMESRTGERTHARAGRSADVRPQADRMSARGRNGNASLASRLMDGARVSARGAWTPGSRRVALNNLTVRRMIRLGVSLIV